MSHYIFGPIESRRFGRSLGIDLSPSKKQCNFDCLYCELAPKAPMARSDEDIDLEALIAELHQSLKIHGPVDVITITANGEPTMLASFDTLINRLNTIKGKTKLLVLTNSSLIDDPSMQKSLQGCDIVKLSLDAVTPEIFKKIDRPDPSIKIESIIEGLKSFSKTYQGEMIIEILVVKGINETKAEFNALYEVLRHLSMVRIDLGTIDRPPAYGVAPVSHQKLIELAGYLHELPVSIIAPKVEKAEPSYYSESEILMTLDHRPLTPQDIDALFDALSKSLLQKLIDEQKVSLQKQGENDFYVLTKNLNKKRKNS